MSDVCDICENKAKHQHYGKGGRVLDLCDGCRERLLSRGTLIDKYGWAWTQELAAVPPPCVQE